MSNIIKLKITFITRIRLWFNKYKLNISNRLKYLEKKAKE